MTSGPPYVANDHFWGGCYWRYVPLCTEPWFDVLVLDQELSESSTNSSLRIYRVSLGLEGASYAVVPNPPYALQSFQTLSVATPAHPWYSGLST